MTSLYDHRATALVNLVADSAMNVINACWREDPSFCIDMRRVVLCCIDVTLPLASRPEKIGLAHEALIVIQQALALDRAVVACREMAA